MRRSRPQRPGGCQRAIGTGERYGAESVGSGGRIRGASVTVASVVRARWGRFFGASVNRRVLGGAVTVGAFTMLVKVAGMVKELAIASRFGRGDEVDAFAIALLLPVFVINIINGSTSPAFVPVYLKVNAKRGADAAKRLLESTSLVSLVAIVGVVFLLFAATQFGMPLLGSNFEPSKLALTRSLSWILIPLIIISILSALWTAVLTAGERFALAAIAPIALPVAIVGAMLLLSRTWGIYSLAVGFVLGLLIQAVLLAGGLKRYYLPLRPRWHGMTEDLKQVIRQYAPLAAGSFLVSGAVVVDQAMGAALPAGSVAALTYGNKIITVVAGVGALAVGTAVLPHFSQMAAVENWSGIRRTLRVYTRLIVVVAVPATIVLALASETIIRILFERGAFTANDTPIVGTIQAFYVLQLPFYLLGILFVRLISALQKNHFLFWGAGINLGLNIVLNFVFMRWIGVAGIALSTAVVYLVSCGYLRYYLHYLLQAKP